jgi:alginate O-acetyltransferase complex protein AlgI
MLFNSFSFILGFLPVTLLGFFILGRYSQVYALAWMLLASLFFYSWWDWRYLPLLLGSIVFHYIIGLILMRPGNNHKKHILYAAIAVDVGLLLYCKYLDLFIVTWNGLADSHVPLMNIVLPLGISFFTFTQIAFLVDVYENKVKEISLLRYGLFVTYFPHLIAGPVLHHNEMMPQFARSSIFKFRPVWFSIGLAVFSIGLAKKVLLADNLADYTTSVFSGNFEGGIIGAWIGVLAYSFQLYFDFSGYSDMAVGLSVMIGIRLPINFFSPYKSQNISDFWRRWHMTLSRFLRDYLYIRLGGNRFGKRRRYFNLITTMFLGGLWHGAGWNFALWGLLHGFYLCVHEFWRASVGRYVPDMKIVRVFSVFVTFLAVAWAWVPFRSTDIATCFDVWSALLGLKGFVLPEIFFASLPYVSTIFDELGIQRMTGGGAEFTFGFLWVAVGAFVAFCFPNTCQLFSKYHPALVEPSFSRAVKDGISFSIRLAPVYAVLLGVLFAISFLFVSRPAQFLYFQF